MQLVSDDYICGFTCRSLFVPSVSLLPSCGFLGRFLESTILQRFGYTALCAFLLSLEAWEMSIVMRLPGAEAPAVQIRRARGCHHVCSTSIMGRSKENSTLRTISQSPRGRKPFHPPLPVSARAAVPSVGFPGSPFLCPSCPGASSDTH